MKTSRRFVASSSSQPALLHPVTPPSAAQFPPPFVRCPRTAAARHSRHCRLQLQDCGLLLMLINSTCCWFQQWSSARLRASALLLWWCCVHEPCDDTRRVHCPPCRLRDNNINTDSGDTSHQEWREVLSKYYYNIHNVLSVPATCMHNACKL